MIDVCTLMTAANCQNMMIMQVAFPKQANYIKVVDYLQYNLVVFDITANRAVHFKQVKPYIMCDAHTTTVNLSGFKKGNVSRNWCTWGFRRVGGY